jgi:carbonic anhydrase
MTRMTPLLGRNEQFARIYTPAALGLPTAQVVVVACLDHRVDPAIVLGLQLGDAPVIRNAGGRVTTRAVIEDIAFLAFLVEQLSGAADTLFEVAVVHHTQCGTGFLADPSFRQQAAEATRLTEAALEPSAVTDPHTTVKADVGRLLTSPLLSPKVSSPATRLWLGDLPHQTRIRRPSRPAISVGKEQGMALLGSVGSIQVMTFECLGDLDDSRFRFLDGRTENGSVGLAPSTDDPFTGTRWEVTRSAAALSR